MKPIKFIPAFCFLLISIILLCLPGSNFPAGWFFNHIPYFDKLVHIGMFGLLCLLFQWPANNSSLSQKQRIVWFWLVSLSAILYGTGMEFVQRYMITNRSFELADIVADTIGSMIALLLAIMLFMKRDTKTIHATR